MVFLGHKNISKYRFDKKIISELRRLELNKEFMADFYDLKNDCYQFDYDKEDGSVLDIRCIVYDEDETSLNAFYKGVQRLRNKYNLNISYDVPLRTWLLYEDPESSSFSPEGYFWHRSLCGSEDRDGEKILTVYVYPETTRKDILEAWPEIKKQQETFYNHKPKRTVMRRNTERDVYIVQLKEQGKKAKEITQIINKVFPEKPITYEYVSALIKRIKK